MSNEFGDNIANQTLYSSQRRLAAGKAGIPNGISLESQLC